MDILRAIQMYYTGNGYIIPLYTRIAHTYTGHTYYYKDSLYSRVVEIVLRPYGIIIESITKAIIYG